MPTTSFTVSNELLRFVLPSAAQSQEHGFGNIIIASTNGEYGEHNVDVHITVLAEGLDVNADRIRECLKEGLQVLVGRPFEWVCGVEIDGHDVVVQINDPHYRSDSVSRILGMVPALIVPEQPSWAQLHITRAGERLVIVNWDEPFDPSGRHIDLTFPGTFEIDTRTLNQALDAAFRDNLAVPMASSHRKGEDIVVTIPVNPRDRRTADAEASKAIPVAIEAFASVAAKVYKGFGTLVYQLHRPYQPFVDDGGDYSDSGIFDYREY